MIDHTVESKKSLNLDGIRTHDVRIISIVALPLRGLTGVIWSGGIKTFIAERKKCEENIYLLYFITLSLKEVY